MHFRLLCSRIYNNQVKNFCKSLNLEEQYRICIKCLLPLGLCCNFVQISSKGNARGGYQFKHRLKNYLHRKEIQDVQRVIQKCLSKKRQMLAEQMQAAGITDNSNNSIQAQQYSSLLILAEGQKLSQIVLEVKQITQKYFIELKTIQGE